MILFPNRSNTTCYPNWLQCFSILWCPLQTFYALSCVAPVFFNGSKLLHVIAWMCAGNAFGIKTDSRSHVHACTPVHVFMRISCVSPCVSLCESPCLHVGNYCADHAVLKHVCCPWNLFFVWSTIRECLLLVKPIDKAMLLEPCAFLLIKFVIGCVWMLTGVLVLLRDLSVSMHMWQRVMNLQCSSCGVESILVQMQIGFPCDPPRLYY